MSMRVAMLGLIGERNRLGGEERLLNVDERLKLDVRAAGRKPANGVSMRFPAKAAGTCSGVGPGSRQDNASQRSGAPFPCNRNEKARGRRER